MAPIGKRILVVDDEPMVCECLAMLLAQDGHQTVEAHNGSEALALLERSDFDLVFTDFKMPGMTGSELARAIHRKHPEKPVVMVTAFPPQHLPNDISLLLVKPL